MTSAYNATLALAYEVHEDPDTPANVVILVDGEEEWQHVEDIDRAATYMGEPDDLFRVLLRSGQTANFHQDTPALIILPLAFPTLRNRMEEPIRWTQAGNNFYHATPSEKVSLAAHPIHGGTDFEWDIIFADSAKPPIHSTKKYRYHWQAIVDCQEQYYRLFDDGVIE